MNLRGLIFKGAISAAIAVGTLPIAAFTAQAASDNTGCGASFTKIDVDSLATYAEDTYGDVADWTAIFSAADKNDDGYLCYHEIGKTCPCGANAINVLDDKSNATQTG